MIEKEKSRLETGSNARNQYLQHIKNYNTYKKKSSLRDYIPYFGLFPGALTARLSTPGFYTARAERQKALSALIAHLACFSALFLFCSPQMPGERKKAGSRRVALRFAVHAPRRFISITRICNAYEVEKGS